MWQDDGDGRHDNRGGTTAARGSKVTGGVTTVAFRPDVNQRPSTNITTMAAAGRNRPLAPHMRPFVPCRCVGLIEEDNSSKPIHFLLGLRGSMTQRDGGAMREVAKRETAAQRER